MARNSHRTPGKSTPRKHQERQPHQDRAKKLTDLHTQPYRICATLPGDQKGGYEKLCLVVLSPTFRTTPL